jgi:hypothetical protein
MTSGVTPSKTSLDHPNHPSYPKPCRAEKTRENKFNANGRGLVRTIFFRRKEMRLYNKVCQSVNLSVCPSPYCKKFKFLHHLRSDWSETWSISSIFSIHLSPPPLPLPQPRASDSVWNISNRKRMWSNPNHQFVINIREIKDCLFLNPSTSLWEANQYL